MSRPAATMIGRTFGSLVVRERDPHLPKSGDVRWFCECVCGTMVSRIGVALRNGETTSCGCLSSRPASAVWSEKTIAVLRRLWAEGHSTSEIGRRLGVSKGTIIGKAHRLQLDGRSSSIKRAGGPKVVGPVPRECPVVALPPLVSDPPVAPVRIQEPVAMPVRARQCEWLSGSSPKDFVRCEHPVARGVFCVAHAAVAYLPRRVREEVV